MINFCIPTCSVQNIGSIQVDILKMRISIIAGFCIQESWWRELPLIVHFFCTFRDHLLTPCVFFFSLPLSKSYLKSCQNFFLKSKWSYIPCCTYVSLKRLLWNIIGTSEGHIYHDSWFLSDYSSLTVVTLKF